MVNVVPFILALGVGYAAVHFVHRWHAVSSRDEHGKIRLMSANSSYALKEIFIQDVQKIM